MSVRVLFSSALRSSTESAKSVTVDAGTLDEVMRHLVTRYPKLRVAVFDERGGRRRSVHLFLNGHDLRGLDEGRTVVSDRDTLEFISSVSGG